MSRGRTALEWLRTVGTRAYDAVSGRRGVALAGAELLGLSALVIAQPIFDALQRSTFVFAAERIEGFDMLLLTALLLLVPPLVMLAIELLVGLFSHSLRGWVHLGWIAMLVAIFAWQAIDGPDETSSLIRLVVLAAGAAGAALYVRFEFARSLARILALAAPVVAYVFLFTSPLDTFTLASVPDVPSAEIDSQTPVVLIVFDELPLAALLDERGQVDAKRFPNFAALARGSDWFRNAVTVADTTEEAVPALLSGDLARPNGAATVADHPRNLFTWFDSSSYRMNVSESATSLCPPAICPGRNSLAERIARLVYEGVLTADSLPLDLPHQIAARLDDHFGFFPRPDQQADAFAASLQAGGPSLNVLHVELPHIPYQFVADGKRYDQASIGISNAPLGTASEMWSSSPGWALQGLQRMTLQLEYTDRVLGRIVARLRRTGLYDRSLFAVIADHGANFIPGHSRRLLDRVNAGPILRVPLFVKRPDQTQGRTIRRPVRTIDLLPTIADVLGVHIPWRVDGRSLYGRPSTRGADQYLSNHDQTFSISRSKIDRGFKAAIAEWNAILGEGDVFTLSATQRNLRRELKNARPLDVTLENPGGSTYDPASGGYPTLTYGHILTQGIKDGTSLITTVNGRPVAIAWSVDGGTRFTTLIPPSAFHPGDNQVKLYAP